VIRRLGYRLLVRGLRRRFRRVVWRGSWHPPAPDRPVVLVANHHAFFDAQLLGFLVEVVLKRRTVVWMEELDRFPFLAMLGARPFPAGNPGQRLATIRETSRLMASDAGVTLIYFPEAHLHPADEGVLPFPEDRLQRLGRVLPRARWWPVAVGVSGWHEATPTAFLTGGHSHDGPPADARAELESLQASLTAPVRPDDRTLLEGRPGPNERWDFSALRRAFIR
jgi:1-acyl-sn-glycerol-3-phosphate acyltransferase